MKVIKRILICLLILLAYYLFFGSGKTYAYYVGQTGLNIIFDNLIEYDSSQPYNCTQQGEKPLCGSASGGSHYYQVVSRTWLYEISRTGSGASISSNTGKVSWKKYNDSTYQIGAYKVNYTGSVTKVVISTDKGTVTLKNNSTSSNGNYSVSNIVSGQNFYIFVKKSTGVKEIKSVTVYVSGTLYIKSQYRYELHCYATGGSHGGYGCWDPSQCQILECWGSETDSDTEEDHVKLPGALGIIELKIYKRDKYLKDVGVPGAKYELWSGGKKQYSGTTDKNGKLVNIDSDKQTLDFTDFYKKARIEAQRLGMDSNFIEYLTPDEFGNPAMPNYMNNVSSKLESIAQAIFNSSITRQKFPGWHAAQVTQVGHGMKVLDNNGKLRELKYHPRVIINKETGVEIEETEYDKLSDEDKNNKDKVVATAEDAIQGALDIIAENISDNAKYRKYIKKICYREGTIVTKAAKPDEKSNYEMYYEFAELVHKLPSHRILAINRGEAEDFLKVSIEKPTDKILYYIQKDIIKGKTQFTEMLTNTIEDAFTRLIEPSIDREIRSDLTEKAEEKAIKVFGQNAKQLLLGAPIKGKTVMGFDPAYRTGCKIAVIDETGKVLDIATVYPTAPQNDVEGAKKTLLDLINKDHVDMIAIGNGTASRESEMFVSDMIKEVKHDICYVIVSEAGASVYSASKLATEEYPDINVSIRGAISIARRLQDPLAELVKIDPKAIGVGQYQHDVNQKNLSESLTGVVEDSVNKVGVDVNTATPSLLSYVSGINNTIAKNIVKYRDENGKLKERKELLKVPKLGKVAFEQCAGFIRIPDGINPLENTAVHPESYKPTEKLLELLGFKVKDLKDKDNLNSLREKLKSVNIAETAEKLEIGEMTLTDIIAELSKPGRDPREDMPKPVLRSDVLKFEDLTEGMILTGTVRNVIDFGAFVDIGVKYDGLVHISEMSDSYIKNPSDLVSVGDIVKVKVIKIDQERKKVGLSMKL